MNNKQKLIIRLNEELKQYQETQRAARQKWDTAFISMSMEDIKLIIEALHGDVYGEELDNYDNDGSQPESKAPEHEE
jgi:hypothetical protein